METTIRNLVPRADRALKAQASFAGKTIGDAVNEAIRAYDLDLAEVLGSREMRRSGLISRLLGASARP